MISNADVMIRLLTAAAIGSIIGFERERLLWAAGIRTHMLVCVGACLVMIVSAYGFQNATRMPHVVLDPSRLAAQVVSGVGFLGAGAILLRGNAIRGMTTAASIWVVAALGLAAGGGLYVACAAATAIILVILVGLKPIEEAYRARIQSYAVHVRAERSAVTPDELKTLLKVRGGQIRRVTQAIGEDGLEDLTIHLVRVSRSDASIGARQIGKHPGVHSVEVRRKGDKHGDAE